LAIPLLLLAWAPAAAAPPRVIVIELRDTVQPASQRYFARGLRHAAETGAALVVIELDTPGGLLVSLRSMTSEILASRVPVAVYVTPSGARAASAGFFLLLSADIAAMAPGTNTGAAHPVTLAPPQAEQPDEEGSRGSLDKITKDAAALARSLAAGRGRSVEWAEKAVVESAAFTAEEARARRLIDVIAVDRAALLRALDGKPITRFDGRTQTLRLHGAEVVLVGRTLGERALALIADPQIAYLLLMLGAIGILIELTSPGFGVPGIAGALSLLLGLYGLSVLPVNVVGALLIAAGVGLLIAEVFVTSYGLLAAAGIVGFVFGSLMLVDAPIPELRIGPAVVVPVAIVLAGVIAILATRAVRSRHLRARSGVEAMVGEAGDVVDRIAPDHDGKVFVHGEYWAAASGQALPAGAKVRVEAIDGLRLRVSPMATTHDRGGTP